MMAKYCRYFFCATLIFSSFKSSAQSTAGITNQPDTSYTTYSAFISTKKSYPDIKIAEEFHSSLIKEKRNIIYCTSGKQKRVAIIIIHGGGWRSGNRTQHFPLAQHLADLGYVCFTPEYRLSTEALYPAAVYDLKAALRWIHANAKKYNVDTAKIVVAGFSAGGQLAALLATTNNNTLFEGAECNLNYSSNVQALIDMDGILSFKHPESGEGDDSKRTSASTYWFGYSKKENPKLLADASALTHVDKNTPPTLFINSGVDRMHAGRTDYIKVLDGYKIFSEVKTFEKAPHSFPLFHPWFGPTVKYIDEFLKKVFLKTKS
jgi:acetyl esterase/lipase